MKIIPNMLYKVECLETFTDGNMPDGFTHFKREGIYEDIPGNVLTRMLESNPDAFEVLEQKVPPPDVSDAARVLAEKHDIDLSKVKGTGKNGNIIKADIEELIEE